MTPEHRTLALVVPNLSISYFADLARTVEAVSHQHGYALLIMDAAEDNSIEQQSFTALSQRNISGAIWIPVRNVDIPAQPYPIVTVDRPIANYDAIFADHRQGGKLVAQHALRLEHRRVGLLSGPQDSPSALMRRKGFYDVARQQLEVVWEEIVPFSKDLPELAKMRLLERSVSLVACANDDVALGVIRFWQRQGWRVPHDLSVIGFDDMPLGDFNGPSLSTVRQPLSTLAKRAVEVLRMRIANPTMPQHREVLPVLFIARESTLGKQSQPTA